MVVESYSRFYLDLLFYSLLYITKLVFGVSKEVGLVRKPRDLLSWHMQLETKHEFTIIENTKTVS